MPIYFGQDLERRRQAIRSEVFVVISLVAHLLIFGSVQFSFGAEVLRWYFLGGGRALPLALRSWMHTCLES
jgi:hypothetical protein